MLAPSMGHAAASEASVKAHLDAATLAAGSDLDGLLRLCQPAPVARPSVTDGGLAKLIATPGPEATKAFDNLFYLGSGWVSAWALKTSDGLVLIDALNTVEETDRLIIGGLRKLGLDPTQIKAVVVTHGHGDHYGGAQRIREVAAVSKPRIVMSELDWTMTQTQLEFASPLWPAPPKRDTARDVAVRDGDSFQQGSTTLTLALTPGHTWGTVSPVFDVQWAGRSHKAIIWGGTGFNFGRDLPRMDAYIASTERMRELVQRERVEVLISNHPGLDNSVSRLAALRADPDAKNPNPYVVGTAHVLRALTVAGECARANRERFEMMP
jgi:metallo-beta-lactamase class B